LATIVYKLDPLLIVYNPDPLFIVYKPDPLLIVYKPDPFLIVYKPDPLLLIGLAPMSRYVATWMYAISFLISSMLTLGSDFELHLSRFSVVFLIVYVPVIHGVCKLANSVPVLL
jgi:hypothetical protein